MSPIYQACDSRPPNTIDAMNERKRGVIGTVIDGTEAAASPRAVASEVMRALCGGAS